MKLAALLRELAEFFCGNKLSNGSPLITTAAAGGGVLLSETLQAQSNASARKAFNAGCDKARSDSRIRPAVFGNSRQFFLMRQNDRADLEDMSRDIGLTELTKHAILSYPLPDQQSGEKFAAFTYLHSDAQNPICGTAHNVASPEMLYISGSRGAQFDQRARDLREIEDVVSAVATPAEKP